MSSKKSFRKNKRSKKKQFALIKNLTRKQIAIICLSIVLLLIISFLLLSLLYHAKNASDNQKTTIKTNLADNGQKWQQNEERTSVNTVHYEFYSSLPNMQVVPKKPQIDDIMPLGLEKPQKLLKPRAHKIELGSAKELEKDVLRQIKHKNYQEQQ